jgi:hypothetical protein
MRTREVKDAKPVDFEIVWVKTSTGWLLAYKTDACADDVWMLPNGEMVRGTEWTFPLNPTEVIEGG